MKAFLMKQHEEKPNSKRPQENLQAKASESAC